MPSETVSRVVFPQQGGAAGDGGVGDGNVGTGGVGGDTSGRVMANGVFIVATGDYVRS